MTYQHSLSTYGTFPQIAFRNFIYSKWSKYKVKRDIIRKCMESWKVLACCIHSFFAFISSHQHCINHSMYLFYVHVSSHTEREHKRVWTYSRHWPTSLQVRKIASQIRRPLVSLHVVASPAFMLHDLNIQKHSRQEQRRFQWLSSSHKRIMLNFI